MRHSPVPAHIIGGVRMLKPAEMPLLKEHLLRLDRESRHDRFNGVADDAYVTRYADRCLTDGTLVIAYVEAGQVRAAAELHPFNGDDAPEVAFSVERPYRGKGLGSVLFTRLIAEARRHGFAALRITTGSENEAMRALARKFGARLTFQQGESSGLIDLEHEAADVDVEAVEATDALLAPLVAGAAWTAPLDVARASLQFNRACWASMMRLYGFDQHVAR
jgi:GNAT superfamily N-acetyltransferase